MSTKTVAKVISGLSFKVNDLLVTSGGNIGNKSRNKGIIFLNVVVAVSLIRVLIIFVPAPCIINITTSCSIPVLDTISNLGVYCLFYQFAMYKRQHVVSKVNGCTLRSTSSKTLWPFLNIMHHFLTQKCFLTMPVFRTSLDLILSFHSVISYLLMQVMITYYANVCKLFQFLT